MADDARSTARADVDALTGEFLRVIDQMWADLEAAERALVDPYLTLTAAERALRQANLERHALRIAEKVQQIARDQIAAALSGAYSLGVDRTAAAAASDATLDLADSDLLRTASSDTYLDILNATRHVQTTTKELVRRLAREAAAVRVRGGVTAEQAGRALAKQLTGYGVTAIVYRDGSRHGLDDYADMLLRTKTAEIYQVGGFEQAKAFGIGWMEILDNPACGLDGHDDPTKANGLILPLSEAERYPISHPRCVRVTVARPDILTGQQARGAAPSTTAAQNADQRRVEQSRFAKTAAGRAAARRTARSGTLLTVGSGAAASPAARRAAARVARRTTGG